MVLSGNLGYLDKAQQEGSICLLLRYLEQALSQGRKRLRKTADFTTASADFPDCSLL